MNVGILGAGFIAEKMATTLQQMPQVTLYAVASRALEKAEYFQQTYGAQKSYGTYEALLADPQVDLVYIATPHSLHYAHAKQCLLAKKNVLCEKSFVMHAYQAQELFALANANGLLIVEAMWTRFLPVQAMIQQVLQSGIIGQAVSLNANIGANLSQVPRLWDKSLAGGALYDLGVYLLHFARMVFPKEVVRVQSSAAMTEEDLDYLSNINLFFDGGQVANLHVNAYASANRNGSICCTQGYIDIDNINNPTCINVYNSNRQLLQSLPTPKQITGFEYEVLACKNALEKGETQCPQLPHSETLYVLTLMDDLLQEWGWGGTC